MKSLSVLVAAFAAGCAPIVSTAEDYKEEQVVERELSFQPGGRLTLKTVNGGITVTSWDRDAVRVYARKKARASSRETAQELLEATVVRIDQGAGRIDIRTEYPDRRMIKRGKSVSAHYTLTVPKRIDLGLRSVNGGVQVDNVSGSVEAKTTNGGVRIAGVRGQVEAKSTNGGIRLAGIRGAVRAGTTNGGIDVEVLEVDGDGGEIRAETTNGGIEVALPKAFKAHLKARTTNGHIDTDFPVTVKGRIGKSVEGDLNGGGRLLYLRTTNGSIRLREL